MDRGYDSIKQLAKQRGVKIPNLLVLANQNDPFYVGAPASVEAANWFAALWKKFDFSTGVHLRRVHYRLVSQKGVKKPNGKPYRNTENDWSYLCNAGKYARYLGLVDPLAFIDRRNPEPHVFANGSGYHIPPSWFIDDPVWNLPELEINWQVDLSLPEPEISGYLYDQSDQVYHLEIWVEKSTIDDVLVPIGREWGVNVVTSLGFQSVTGIIAMLQRIRESRKPARIFYISDFDPAGDGMPVAVARQVEYWRDDYAPDADIALSPIVLTRDQVKAYNLPRIPVKDSDLRKAHFEERYGQGAVELDALEALHPGALSQIVTEAINLYRDDELPDRLAEVEEEAQQVLDDAWEDAAGHYRAELESLEENVSQIVERYQSRVTELRDAMNEEIAPFKDRLDVLRQAIIDARDALKVELPDRPEAELDEPDENDWLFHSEREYFDQLAVYKAHQNGAED